MKKRIFLLAAVVSMAAGAHVQAQSTRAVPASAGVKTGSSTVSYALPRTALTIRVTVDRETIRRGPYSRFAQKYLGVVAPLSDKEIHTLTGAAMSWASEADPSAVYVLENPEKSLFDLYGPSMEGFIVLDPNGKQVDTPRFAPFGEVSESRISTVGSSLPELPIDKTASYDPGLEQAAEQAAQTLFTLRKRRFDLVSGEAGENVFGAGLPAALDELKRQEEAYIALFMGTRTVESVTRSYEIVPEAGMNSVIVCRFSEAGGLLPAGDLSGRPLLLEMTPEQKTRSTVLPRPGGRENRGSIFYRVADVARCRLLDEMNVLLDRRVPIYQFGQVVDIPVTAIK